MVFPNAILYEDLSHVQTKRVSLKYFVKILLHVDSNMCMRLLIATLRATTC